MSGFGNGRKRMGYRFASRFALDGLRKINRSNIKFRALNQPSDGRFANRERMLIGFYDMINRLPTTYKRRHDVVDLY